MFNEAENYNFHAPTITSLSPLVITSKGKVFVQGRFANHQTRQLFQMYGYQPVDKIDDADIVCWTGGEDINPKIYNENPAGA